jgi:hypothetical protein
MAAEFIFSTPYIFGVLWPQIWERFLDLVLAVFRNPDMIWIVTPLLITLFLMEFYFGRYKKEELGWNSAVGNSLVLIFVSIDLFRQLYSDYFALSELGSRFSAVRIETFIALLVGLVGLSIAFANFFHKLPKQLAFTVSSAFTVNFTAYVAIAIIYGSVSLDWFTVVAAFMLFLLMAALFSILHLLEPEYVARYQGNIIYKMLGKLVRLKEEAQPKKKVKREKPIIPYFAEKKAKKPKS